MRSLLAILGLWRGRLAWLIWGMVLSLLAVGVALALMQQAGSRIALAGAGLLTASVAIRSLGVARVLLRYGERLVTHDATFRALADVRVWFFRGFAGRSAGGLGFTRSGDLLSRLVQDVEALDGLYLRILLPFAGALLVMPALVWGVGPAIAGWGLPMFIGVMAFIAAIALPFFAARVAAGAGERLAAAGSGLRIAVVDTLSGIREIRAFSAADRMRGLIAEREAKLFVAQERVFDFAAWIAAAGFLCGQAVLMALLVSSEAAPIPAVAAVFLVVAGFEVLTVLPRAGALAGHAAAAAQRVLEAARGEAPYPDPSSPANLPSSIDLRFESVHFHWMPGRPNVFDGLTMEVPKGSRVAILGPSGAGKSTLAALALKIARPQFGRIFLGGVDLANLAAADVRGQISYLSQSTHLFQDTIRSNLLLNDSKTEDAAIWAALDQAAIGDFVRSLPNGLDSWLGEGGAGVSGGQGRRLALARALLSAAPILILDEPCAGLDADTEREFMSLLNTLEANKTVILIVHRLTGVEKLDRIWRISQGKAVAAAG
jgi:ATP-binding cassette subfamily C protein CydC